MPLLLGNPRLTGGDGEDGRLAPTPLPVTSVCRRDPFLGDLIGEGSVELGAGLEGDLDLNSDSVSSLTSSWVPGRALLLLSLPRPPPLSEDKVSTESSCELSDVSRRAELSLSTPIAGIAGLPKVTAESADSDALVMVSKLKCQRLVSLPADERPCTQE